MKLKRLLKEENVAIRPGFINEKMKSLEKKGHLICLGIESTAQ